MRARGFSIVEFMIAITIGLFLIAGLVYLIAETSRSRAEIERSSRQIENGRYALDRIAEDIRHAGYFSDYFSVPAVGASGFPASLQAAIKSMCDATAPIPTAELVPGMPLAIQAYDGVATLPTDLGGDGCNPGNILSGNYQPNTDILVVRRASTSALCPSTTATDCCPSGTPAGPYTSYCTTAAPAANLAAAPNSTQAFIQTTASEYKLDVGANVANFTLTHPMTNTTASRKAPVRRYILRIYFVAKCNVPASGTICNGTTDDGGTSIPTLKMLELGVDPVTSAGPKFNLLPVAEGIEHLQFDFGIDTDGDGVADTIKMCDATVSPCTVADFGNVVTVQVNLVARNTETSPGYADDKIYRIGEKGYTTATNDKYRRHAYSSLVRVSNVAMRRE